MALRRRSIKRGERLTKCQFCDYPFSQRHHALPISVYGENNCTLQLCANCHELYHIVERAFLFKSKSSAKLLESFFLSYGKDDIRYKKACHFIAAAVNIARGETV